MLSLFACAARLFAEANRHRETGNTKYRVTVWKVFYNACVTFLTGFLTGENLRETTLGNGKRMLLTAVACFLAPAIVDALILVNGRMILNEFLKWLTTKTGAAPTEIEKQDETDNPKDTA